MGPCARTSSCRVRRRCVPFLHHRLLYIEPKAAAVACCRLLFVLPSGGKLRSHLLAKDASVAPVRPTAPHLGPPSPDQCAGLFPTGTSQSSLTGAMALVQFECHSVPYRKPPQIMQASENQVLTSVLFPGALLQRPAH